MTLIFLHVTVYIFRCIAYFSLCIISMRTWKWNSVACNTTRRCLFCVMCYN